MRIHFWPARVLPLIAAVLVVSPGTVVNGQSPPATRPSRPPSKAAAPVIPRTPEGRPDLQGTWDFAQLTPFERPGEFAGKSALSDEEAEEFAQSRSERDNKDRRDGPATTDVERAYNDFWWDFGKRVATQTSLIVDPPDGRLPAPTADAQRRFAERRPRYDNVEERPLAERCIMGFNSGPPMIPSAYNNNMQLVQTRNHVLIFNEMVHSARIVDMSGTPHPPASLRFLAGHSTGHWDGDTLIVDTTNFAKEGNFRASSVSMHLVERFRREDSQTLRYEFTMDDPAVWTKKWTASIPMALTDEMMFEYACHEANYGLEGVLKGARFEEKDAKTP